MRKILCAIIGLLFAIPSWGACHDYTSATGTVVQDGTPTPDNPIDLVFYTQGDMVLRKVGDVADSYDATTGKITRRIQETKLTPNGGFGFRIVGDGVCTVMLPAKVNTTIMSTHFANDTSGSPTATATNHISTHPLQNDNIYFRIEGGFATATDCMNWVQEQINAGTPVMIYSIMPTETEETIGTQWCDPIKIATTKYVETQFSDLNSRLAAAVATVNTVVTNTINQAASIATLQSGKQTRPADETCPAYKQCLLVEDEQGVPHWYQITDPFRDFVTPIITNNVAPASTTNQPGYTQLEYIESTGTQWIDTGVYATQDTAIETKFVNMLSDSSTTVLIGDAWTDSSYLLSIVAHTSAQNRIGGLNNMLRDFWRVGQDYIVKMDKTGLYVNNSKINWDGSATEFTTTKPLYLLGDPAASNRRSYAMLYYMKIYNNGTLVRNFIPVKRNSDGAIGMYDTVTKTFFTNAGTGTFTDGPTVANTDVPANPTWTATWTANATTGVSAGTMYGEGLCNLVGGTFASVATSTQTSSSNWSASGAGCWCHVTAVDDRTEMTKVDGAWVSNGSFSSAAECTNGCASYCVDRVGVNGALSKALFGM